MMPKSFQEKQFASYLPISSSTQDLPAADSSRQWLQNNKHQVPKNGDGYNDLSSPCNTSRLQDHEKEIIKRIMLQQEATFKHQVSELHRVYGRQQDLMDEINMKGKTSNPIMSRGLSESNQTSQIPNFTLVDPSCHWPSRAYNFQIASNFDAGKSMQAATNTSIIGSSFKDNVLLPSSSKESRKRTFDLELPADDYIDHEEERFKDGTVSGVSKVPDYAMKDLSAVCNQKDIKLSICRNRLNPSEGNSSGTNLNTRITNLAGLNKTFQLNKKGTLYPTSLLPLDTNIMEELHLEQSYSHKSKMVFQLQTKEIDCMQTGKDLENRSEDLYLEKMSRQHEHTFTNHLMSFIKPSDTPEALSIGKHCLNNIRLHGNWTSANIGSLQNNLLHRLPADKVDSYRSEMSKDGARKYQIDLNSSPYEDGSAQVEVEMKSAADINFEPPVSPENKESSPPRGNSVENDDKCQKDVVLLAAEALHLLSSNSAQCLKWFAGVVSSVANAEKDENETVQGHLVDGNYSEVVADGFNNFAALTPRMEDIKFEDCCFNSTGNKKGIAPATSSSPPKRKRTRRTKSQKAMQGNILPRISSTSRQEVSQETRTISGLREDAGQATLGKKKLSQNERQKGKKQNSKSIVLRQRSLPVWGRRNRRQTGQRRPASSRALRLVVDRLKVK